MYKRLLALDEENMPLRVAVIGCGRFGSMVAAQVLRAPGMELSVVCDLDVERALEVLRLSGRDPDDATVTSKVGGANDAMEAKVDRRHRGSRASPSTRRSMSWWRRRATPMRARATSTRRSWTTGTSSTSR